MKKAVIITGIILFLAVTASTVFAIPTDNQYYQGLINQGYTEQDLEEIQAIVALSDENIVAYIVKKYKLLGNWQKVREVYGVSEEDYQKYMETQAKWRAVLDKVPSEFMSAMKEKMTTEERYNFISQMQSMEIDFEYAWNQYKSGKTPKEIIDEEKEKLDKETELTTKYVKGEITNEEFMKSIAPIVNEDKMTIGEILSKVQKLRTEVRNRHKIRSGITDEEIAYCEKKGLTNPMDMFQAKYISNINKVPFNEVVNTRIKNSDWIETVAEVLNVSVEEYTRQMK